GVAPASSLDDGEHLVGADSVKKAPVASAKSTDIAPKKEAAKPPPEKTEKPKEPPRKEPARTDEGSKARALLEGRDSGAKGSSAPEPARAKAASEAREEERFIVQVGAFAENAKARETRLKVEAAGLKTYTHVADTKDGRRIRVRVGPYDSRAEAEKAAKRIKGLGLPAAILTL
ncbi:MAG TPA: SPOR domain-containing protein, partial [Burkholderiaceae bacterium]